MSPTTKSKSHSWGTKGSNKAQRPKPSGFTRNPLYGFMYLLHTRWYPFSYREPNTQLNSKGLTPKKIQFTGEEASRLKTHTIPLVHRSFHLSTVPASGMPSPTLPSPVSLFPKKVLEVIIRLPRAIRACVPSLPCPWRMISCGALWLMRKMPRNQLRTSFQIPCVKIVSRVHL